MFDDATEPTVSPRSRELASATDFRGSGAAGDIGAGVVDAVAACDEAAGAGGDATGGGEPAADDAAPDVVLPAGEDAVPADVEAAPPGAWDAGGAPGANFAVAPRAVGGDATSDSARGAAAGGGAGCDPDVPGATF